MTISQILSMVWICLFLFGCRKGETQLVQPNPAEDNQLRSGISEIEVEAIIDQALHPESIPEDVDDITVDNVLNEALNQDVFLATDYTPLDKWFDESFEVKYRAMTPQIIFDQVPLSDIHYELEDLPTGLPAFEFASTKVSRRELLEAIAKHWNLELSFVKGEDGNPSAVRVRPKG